MMNVNELDYTDGIRLTEGGSFMRVKIRSKRQAAVATGSQSRRTMGTDRRNTPGNQAMQRLAVSRQRHIHLEHSPADQLAHQIDHAEGSSLPAALRLKWQGRMGVDLGGLRIHTDSASTEAVKQSGANAIGYGNHLFFDSGKYDPYSPSGQALLGHEIAHSLQTRPSKGEKTPVRANRQSELEHEADNFGKHLADGSGVLPKLTLGRAPPAMRGDKQINFSGNNISVSDTYVVHGPGVSDAFVQRFQEALDEYYNDPAFSYRGYDVNFRLSVRREQTVTRTAGVVDWESTDWGSDEDTMLINVDTGTGRAGGIGEITVYETSTKGTIAHEIGHYLSDRIDYFSEGYTEGVASRLGIGEHSTEIRPEAIMPDGTVDIMARSQTGVVTDFSLGGILDEAIDEHEAELAAQQRWERFNRELIKHLSPATWMAY